VVLYIGLATVCSAGPFSAAAFIDTTAMHLPHNFASKVAMLVPWMAVVAVVGNLGFSARQTHQWYIKTFPLYPKSRWAFLPGLF
jgi:hypothetical protein